MLKECPHSNIISSFSHTKGRNKDNFVFFKYIDSQSFELTGTRVDYIFIKKKNNDTELPKSFMAQFKKG